MPGCALHDEGILASLQDCKDKCTDATCYGLQYYISTGQCYNFQETTGCKMLQYNGAETILIYRQSGRTGKTKIWTQMHIMKFSLKTLFVRIEPKLHLHDLIIIIMKQIKKL